VFQPFPNITGNLYESVTLGSSFHQRHDHEAGNSEVQDEPNIYITKDYSIPAAGQFAEYPADNVLRGTNPTQLFLPFQGNILETSVFFDNGVDQGIVYPSTCVRKPL